MGTHPRSWFYMATGPASHGLGDGSTASLGTIHANPCPLPIVHGPLSRMEPTEFAVIDVETTNGDPLRAGIIEVAAIAHDGLRELDRWNTLIRSTQPISPFIQRLTGIRPGMLKGAPTFADAGHRLASITKGRIMVAHNVRYDMTALQQEYARTGIDYRPPTLCTERLARQLIPGITHYNLGSLCRHLGIERGHEHRAAHDAQATLNLLLRLIADHGLTRVMDSVSPGRELMRA